MHFIMFRLVSIPCENVTPIMSRFVEELCCLWYGVLTDVGAIYDEYDFLGGFVDV